MSNKVDVKVNPVASIGLPGLLTITFVILKALGYITWSWWWVFSPLWISFLVGVGIFGIVLVVCIGIALLPNKIRSNKIRSKKSG